ncbi:hypothetical protein [Novosphingobium album (ex Liu et al. 2023)]|uniref:Uncharacterized protein n=1 Tax=Novosphingobium album (ex Liu et al. 2023) TaxID=3031130 RepID=A0ABT5WMU1_9SPHN|nr:hypothetical protein [Novosphingobium album (ex Liu et al. 2023)]MDE8650248.1 hypothetical protein [Novosphingobium album (ex Liu et al. 2023)]
MALSSFRSRLRAFRIMRGDPPDPGFVADLEFLENRDLDLSVKLGAVLAFNILLITVGTHPLSASPGAPLSLDAASHPLLTIASAIGLSPMVVSCYFALRAITHDEEFDADGLGDEDALRQRLLATFVHSIDTQKGLLRRAVIASVAGGIVTLALWAVILAAKMTA